MIEKVKNEGTVSGKLYDFGRFGLKEDKEDGKIRGSVIVATDNDMCNLVEVHFLPQAKTYSTGKENNNYKVLKKLIDEGKSVVNNGEKDAFNLRISASLTTNPYYFKDNGSNDYTFREPMQIKGNFIHIDEKAKPYNGFNVDCLIENIEDMLNSDGTASENKKVKVRVFDDYRKEFMPFSMVIESPEGIDYIQSNYLPGETYTTLSCMVVDRSIEKEDKGGMGFGEKAVTSQPKKVVELLIIGADLPKDTFPMNEEEMLQCKQNRETRLAEIKNKAIEKNAASNNVKTGFGATNTSAPTSQKSIASNKNPKYDF